MPEPDGTSPVDPAIVAATEAADRFEAAVEAIDAANAADPVRVVVDGVERPKELVHADAVERWLRVVDPAPTVAQVLAARAHHLRRWVVPRTDYPEGRAGYLRWRTDHKRRQADEVATILRGVGYDEATIERVAAIVAKRNLAHDPQVQAHEDALCLTFIEFQFDDVTHQLGFDHMVEVVRKTIRKMSPAGLAATAAIEVSAEGQAVLAAALSEPADGVEPT